MITRCNFGHWPTVWNRRQFLQTTGAGFATLAMQYLLGREGLLAAPPDVATSREGLGSRCCRRI